MSPRAEDQVRFLLNVQRILAEGDFTATYKYALLMALADICVERGDRDGPTRITTRQIAEKFIQYYWRHARPFTGAPHAHVLLQNTGNQAAVVSAIIAHQRTHAPSMTHARQDPDTWKTLVTGVSRVVRDQPLWKLQTVGGRSVEFLYRRETYARSTITLEPGVAEHFRTFYDLVHNLARAAWIQHVRRLEKNRPVIGENVDLGEFLFGTPRHDLARYREVLADLQHGTCFYCGRGIGSDPAVDHFIPWARYPNDLAHNFVLADPSCNASKKDRLAHPEHLERWVERNATQARDLARAFDEEGLAHDIYATRNVARWAYETDYESQGLVWVRGRRVVPLDDTWKQLLV